MSDYTHGRKIERLHETEMYEYDHHSIMELQAFNDTE